MADYPDMRAMARLATENYDHLESLEQIRPPFPSHGSPNWWALRLRYEQLLESRMRRLRNGSTIKFPDTAAMDEAAKWTALGNEHAQAIYERRGNR